VIPSLTDETHRPGETPAAYVQRVAADKAQTISQEQPGFWVLAADTIVTLNGHILGKPGSTEIAREMLATLSGQTHQVMTAFVLLNETGQSAAAEVVTSEVTFQSNSDAEIDAYLATGESFDKAGAYAVQGKGRVLVGRVTGSLTNVIGLPMDEVGAALRTAGLLA
jgi:septum formation protein